MTRAEHLAWSKERAREYLDAGDWRNAWASFASDMAKHEETKGHPALVLEMQLLIAGSNQTSPRMRKFIEDFR